MNEVEWVIIKGRLAQHSYFACRANSTNARDGEKEKKRQEKGYTPRAYFFLFSFFSLNTSRDRSINRNREC